MNTGTINLLPKEEKKRDIKSIVYNIFMVLMIILLAAVILFSIFLFDIDRTLSQKLSEYEDVNIKTLDQANKLKVYDDFSNDLQEKKEIIDVLTEDEILWSKIIYDIGKYMPEGAYIKTFTAQGTELYKFLDEYKKGEAEEGKQVVSFSITGEALEYKEVLKLVIELNKIENFEQVWIQNITNINSSEMDKNIIGFTIDTFWDLDYFTEDIKQQDKAPEEDILDMELEDFES